MIDEDEHYEQVSDVGVALGPSYSGLFVWTSSYGDQFAAVSCLFSEASLSLSRVLYI